MRTPENFELTNAQEFGSSWAATEVNSQIMILSFVILGLQSLPGSKASLNRM